MKTALIINIFTAIFVFIVGLLFLLNIIPSGSSSNRVIFSIILIGYGVYRFMNFLTKYNLSKQEKSSKNLKEKTQKVINNIRENKIEN
jgi:predicted RNA-binding protein with PUA domain